MGHNPLGAGSVFAMLLVLLAQVGTGLFGDDEIAFTGPLISLVSSATVLALTAYHEKVGQFLVIGLVLLHIAAVLFYLLKKRQNLVQPMLTGDKELPAPTAGTRDDARSRLAALGVLAAAAAVVAWLVRLGAPPA